MTILFGHPSGHPGSHNTALAYFEAGILESFCVPWMPSAGMLRLLESIAPVRPMVQRLARRHFPPLADAPKIQGRAGELRRLSLRLLGVDGDRLLANKWLMRTMARECDNPRITAVHAFEDCSLWQFEKAKRLGKFCIYNMPQAYFPVREQAYVNWIQNYADWIPGPSMIAHPSSGNEHKRREIFLADLVFVPSKFLERSIRPYFPDKTIVVTPYGVDSEFWTTGKGRSSDGRLRFLYVGRVAPHKGVPLLLDAWRNIGLRDAELELVGPWLLADSKRRSLPANVVWHPPCSRETLRERYRQADVFVFPSYYEGFGNVLVEALACGLPVICSDSTAGPDLVTERCGRVIPTGSLEALMDSLMWFHQHRDELPTMKLSARSRAEGCSWQDYRRTVTRTVRSII